jgi:hypothetical protein
MALSSFMVALALAGHASQAETAPRTASTTVRSVGHTGQDPGDDAYRNVNRCPALCALELALLP